MTIKIKTQHCDECWHGKWDVPTSDLICDKGHKPRFFRMKSPLDQTFGFKRKCEDFVDKHVARHFEKEK